MTLTIKRLARLNIVTVETDSLIVDSMWVFLNRAVENPPIDEQLQRDCRDPNSKKTYIICQDASRLVLLTGSVPAESRPPPPQRPAISCACRHSPQKPGKDPARLGGHGTMGTKERTKDGRRLFILWYTMVYNVEPVVGFGDLRISNEAVRDVKHVLHRRKDAWGGLFALILEGFLANR